MALRETFEDKEEKLFGKNGFEKIVGQGSDLEKQLGIYELSRFTPEVRAWLLVTRRQRIAIYLI
jgi:hypothetical protein